MKNKHFTCTHTFTTSDIELFLKLSKDTHPLHSDTQYAQKKGFKDVVVPGLLTGALFSQIIGNQLPDRDYFYISQSLIFHKPVYVNETLEIEGNITHELLNGEVIILTTNIYRNEEIVVSGEARAKRFAH